MHINVAKIQISHNYAYVCNYKSSQKINHMKIKEEYELQNICGEAMLIPCDAEKIDEKEIISLDPISEYLWREVATMQSFTTDTLVSMLMQEYDVDEDTAREDCVLIAEAWLEMGIVTE